MEPNGAKLRSNTTSERILDEREMRSVATKMVISESNTVIECLFSVLSLSACLSLLFVDCCSHLTAASIIIYQMTTTREGRENRNACGARRTFHAKFPDSERIQGLDDFEYRESPFVPSSVYILCHKLGHARRTACPLYRYSLSFYTGCV